MGGGGGYGVLQDMWGHLAIVHGQARPGGYGTPFGSACWWLRWLVWDKDNVGPMVSNSRPRMGMIMTMN